MTVLIRRPFSLLLFATLACGDDTLEQRFEPSEPNLPRPDDTPSPLSPGDYGYFVASFFYPQFDDSTTTQPRLGASASVCLRVDEVRDRAGEQPSTLEGRVRRTGASSLSVTYQDSVAGTAANTEIDAALSPLWLKQVIYPDATPLDPASSRTFTIESGPRPDADLDSFFFVELRELANWSGFSSVTGETFDWFMGPPLSLSGNDFFDPTVFDSRPPPVSDIESFTLTWRATGGDSFPAELRGTVIHSLRLDYDDTGVLRSARELITPDLAPSTPVDAGRLELVCLAGEPCMQSLLLDDTFDTLFCDF